MEDKSFLGRGWSFPPEFGKRETPTNTVNEEIDIRQSLIILFSTRPGERFNRNYGCGLDEFIYEPLNSTTLALIESRVKRAVELYEPRIELRQVQLDLSREVDGILMIELDYLIRKTNTIANLVYPFYMEK